MRARALPWLMVALLSGSARADQKPRRDAPTLVTRSDAAREREAQERPGIPVARVAHADGHLEAMAAAGAWARLREGGRVATGDRLRTADATTARVDFPWVELGLGANTELAVQSSRVLTAELETGRAEQRAEKGAHLMRMLTPEAFVRGDGHVVVRREAGLTLVSVLEGRVLVSSGGRTVLLREGQGAIARPGAPPEPAELPAPPTGLVPGSDPAYAIDGREVSLAWRGSQGQHVIQVFELDSDAVLLQRDVAGHSATLEVPWEGTFRWRVATRASSGLEGLPSDAGYFCRVAR
jgi:hypothetical protein